MDLNCVPYSCRRVFSNPCLYFGQTCRIPQMFNKRFYKLEYLVRMLRWYQFIRSASLCQGSSQGDLVSGCSCNRAAPMKKLSEICIYMC